jgi:2'-deoxynucleoside 5'-phosphate N-hydrolase
MPRTIYFAGSISGGRHDAAHYGRIVAYLERHGHTLLAGAVASEHIGTEGEPLSSRDIFERDLGWLAQAAEANGVLVAEVSTPSTGVGYEIASARYKYRLPVICLYRPAFTTRCTAMVSGDAGIRLIEYGDDSVEQMLERLLEALKTCE